VTTGAGGYEFGGFDVIVGEDDSDFDLVLLFEDERDPRERDVEDWTREDDSFRLLRDIEIEIDEEVVHVHGEVPTRDVFEVGIL